MGKRRRVKEEDEVRVYRKPTPEDIEAERRLWIAVMLRAARDIIEAKTVRDATRAYAWFTSNSMEERSFIWICNSMGLGISYLKSKANKLYHRRINGVRYKATRGGRLYITAAEQ
jgi:hypothetical protein